MKSSRAAFDTYDIIIAFETLVAMADPRSQVKLDSSMAGPMPSVGAVTVTWWHAAIIRSCRKPKQHPSSGNCLGYRDHSILDYEMIPNMLN